MQLVPIAGRLPVVHSSSALEMPGAALCASPRSRDSGPGDQRCHALGGSQPESPNLHLEEGVSTVIGDRSLTADVNVGEGMEQAEDIQQPQHHGNHHNSIEDRFDRSLHRLRDDQVLIFLQFRIPKLR